MENAVVQKEEEDIHISLRPNRGKTKQEKQNEKHKTLKTESNHDVFFSAEPSSFDNILYTLSITTNNSNSYNNWIYFFCSFEDVRKFSIK